MPRDVYHLLTCCYDPEVGLFRSRDDGSCLAPNFFNAGNYGWTVFSRTITYGFGFGKFTTNLFGQEFSIAFGKSIFRGMLGG